MCDDKDKGLTDYSDVTRRGFATLAAGGVAVAAGAASANAPLAERDVHIKAPDGLVDAALFAPGGGPKPGVILWPDIGGLRPAMRDMGRRLAAQGYVVLVVNPFWRSGTEKNLLARGEAAGDRTAARALQMEWRKLMTDESIDGAAKAFVAYLDGLKETSDAKVGVQGYCMGGPTSFRTAGAAPARIGAVATFHGGGLATDKPNSPHLLVEKTKAAYLVCVAQNDDAKDPQAKETLKETFAKTGRPAKVEVYAGDHGWCVPDSAVYNQPEAERAWAQLLALYKTNLV